MLHEEVIKIGDLTVQDSGYIKATNEGTQASAANRANGGDAITLKQVEFIPSLKRNHANNPELSSNTPSEVNLGSLENMQFKLRLTVNTKTSADMALVKHLLDCVSTNGYKFLWYNYTEAADLNGEEFVYNLALNDLFGHQFTNGEKSAFTVSDNFYHLHVHLLEAQFRNTARSNMVVYEFTGKVIPVETSTI